MTYALRMTLGQWVMGVVLGVGASTGGQAASFPPSWAVPMQWQGGEHVQVMGMPLQYARFHSDWPLDKLAAALALDDQRFQVFTQVSGRWMLSGYRAGEHWVVQMAAGPTGTQGLVSRWRVPPTPATQAAQGRVGQVLSSVPALQPVMHIGFQQGQTWVEQAVFLALTPLARLQEQVGQTLLRQGWQQGDGSAAAQTVVQHWRQGKQALVLRFVMAGKQPGVWVHYNQ